MRDYKGDLCETVEEEQLAEKVDCCFEEVQAAIDFAIERYPFEVQQIVRDRIILI